ncbi:hypothetical protein BDN67DRAFT_985249 [Paxillus ammoniavirescens]|nr:hypothetical protein BDN67DRAFT_985249 [Paxillus ammoniavirescens]
MLVAKDEHYRGYALIRQWQMSAIPSTTPLADAMYIRANTTTTAADAMHDPHGEVTSPGNVPPSIWLEGEKIRQSSLNVKVNDIKKVEDNPDDQTPPRDPVCMQDSDTCCPSEPTEPSDDKEGV